MYVSYGICIAVNGEKIQRSAVTLDFDPKNIFAFRSYLYYNLLKYCKTENFLHVINFREFRNCYERRKLIFVNLFGHIVTYE